MNVLIVGSGGREHALAWKIKQSPNCGKLYCAPGNAGIAAVATCVDIAADAVDALVEFAKDHDIGLVVIGPEAPLVAGLADKLADAAIPAFGPSALAARLEGSKGFMKDICAKYDIPTAAYQRFTDAEAALAYVREQGAPIVIKADGLAAGKGVVVAQSLDEAEEAVRNALVGGQFGDAGASIVVEEFMDGEEVSYFALVDENNVLCLTSAQDHKAVGEGDTGPNTGGMGAYSPAPVLTPELEAVVEEDIIQRTVHAMKEEGCPFTGVLFAGLMIVDGPHGKQPKLVEFNVRFGDPECQALMMRLDGDLLGILSAAAHNALDSVDVKWRTEAALCVVMAANGYPGSYEKHTPIAGLERAGDVAGVQVFHAGTAQDAQGRIVANGGRVLGVTALGADVSQAQKRAYEAVDQIEWPEGFCRRDIGWRVVGRPD